MNDTALPFDTALLIHVTGADLLLLLLPFTRIVHCVLLPLAQYASQLGWHLVPGAGARVREALRDESASTHEVTV